MKLTKRNLIILFFASVLIASSASAFRSTIGFWRELQLVDYTSAHFGFGINTGTSWDATNSFLRLNQTGPTNNSALDASWAPQWSHIVGYWKMDETAGSTSVADSSSGGTNSGTVNGGVSLGIPGVLNTAANFDGSSGYIELGNPSNLPSGTSSRSMCAWAKTNTVASGYRWPIAYGSPSSGQAMFIGMNGTLLQAGGYGSGNDLQVSNFWNVGIWYHLCLTYDGSLASLYANGTLLTSQVLNWNLVLNEARIGQQVNSGGEFWNGSIDEVAIWSTSLTSAEIQNIYQRQSSKYAGTFTSRVIDGLAATASWKTLAWTPTLPFFKALPDNALSESPSSYSSQNAGLMSGSLGLWHLDEVAGTSGTGVVMDRSGNGFNGDVQGTITFGSAGRLGTSAIFSGSGSVGNLNLGAAGTSDWTESSWIQTSSAVAGTILTNRGYSTNPSLTLDIGIYGNHQNWDGKVYFSLDNNGCESGVVSSGSVADGHWHHLVGTRASGIFSLYVDGILQPQTLNYIGYDCSTASATSTDPWQIGWSPQWSSSYFNGSIDEVGVWNRALSSSEVLELYRRGANRIKYQVRSCADGTCSTNPAWLGPDGTNQTYFSELNNNAVPQDAADLGSRDLVQTGLPSLSFANFSSLSVPANRYLQYRAILESDDTSTNCNYGSGATWCSPELKSVSMIPQGSTLPTFVGVSFYKEMASSSVSTPVTTCAAGHTYVMVGHSNITGEIMNVTTTSSNTITNIVNGQTIVAPGASEYLSAWMVSCNGSTGTYTLSTASDVWSTLTIYEASSGFYDSSNTYMGTGSVSNSLTATGSGLSVTFVTNDSSSQGSSSVAGWTNRQFNNSTSVFDQASVAGTVSFPSYWPGTGTDGIGVFSVNLY